LCIKILHNKQDTGGMQAESVWHIHYINMQVHGFSHKITPTKHTTNTASIHWWNLLWIICVADIYLW
jgi:hypothetical protein